MIDSGIAIAQLPTGSKLWFVGDLLFTQLQAPPSRWKSFLIGWNVQVLWLACLVFAGSRLHQSLTRPRYDRVTNLVAYRPLLLPPQQPSERRVSALPQPMTEHKAPLAGAPLQTALVVTPQPKTVREQKVLEPELSAPVLNVESKMPVIPNSPQPQIVALNTFANSKASIVAAKPVIAVQAGTFGDPNGIAASNGRKKAGIVQKGSFDSTGGTGPAGKTDGRVVMNAGFDKAAIGTGNGPSIHPAGALRQANAKAGLPVEVTFKPKPKYTDEGRKQNISGEVCLEVLFKSDGRIDVLRVVRGLGYGLDEQAVKAAEQIKFKPALQEGQPVDSVALVHIIFELIS